MARRHRDRRPRAAGPTPSPLFIRGALAVARGAGAAAKRARVSELALVNGVAGLVMASEGRLSIVLSFTVANGRITEIDVIADPGRLQELDLAVVT